MRVLVGIGSVVKILRQEHPVDFDLELQTRCQTPRARSELGWMPKHSDLPGIVSSALRYYRLISSGRC